MAGEHVDGRSRSLAVRKTQIRTVMGHWSTPTRTAITQTGLTSVVKDVGKPKPACQAGGNMNVKWHSLPLWRMERAARHGRRSPCAPALTGAGPRGAGTRPHRSSTSHREATGGNDPKVPQAAVYTHRKERGAHTSYHVRGEAPAQPTHVPQGCTHGRCPAQETSGSR